MIGTGIFILKNNNLFRKVMRHSTAINVLKRQKDLSAFAVRYSKSGEWVTESATDYLKSRKQEVKP